MERLEQPIEIKKVGIWLEILPFYGTLEQWYLLMTGLSKKTKAIWIDNELAFRFCGRKYVKILFNDSEDIDSLFEEFYTNSPLVQFYSIIFPSMTDNNVEYFLKFVIEKYREEGVWNKLKLSRINEDSNFLIKFDVILSKIDSTKYKLYKKKSELFEKDRLKIVELLRKYCYRSIIISQDEEGNFEIHKRVISQLWKKFQMNL
jgi:hypothetical protein